MNNRLPDHALSVTERGRPAGDWLRNAVNVDITDVGTVLRRPGYTLAVSGSDAHSLWSDDDVALCVESNRLCVVGVVGGGLSLTEVRTGLTPGLEVSYARMNDAVYWSNGVVLEKVVGGASLPVGVDPLNPEPIVGAGAGGSLAGGRYMVALTRRNAAGEESGSTIPVVVDVPENGHIEVSGIVSGSDAVSIYMSPVNGDVLFRAAVLASGTTSWTAPVMPQLAGRLQTLLLQRMPPGGIVGVFNGRLLVASGSALYYSEPYAPALFNPSRGYILFPAPITILAPCIGGMYVVADKTYWLAGGDIDQAVQTERLPYGAVPRTYAADNDTSTVWWFSDKGLVVGNSQGELRNMQEDSVVVERAGKGALYRRDQNGMRQVVAALFDAQPTQAVATSYAEAEVIRKGDML